MVSSVPTWALLAALLGTAAAKFYAIVLRPETIPHRWIVDGVPPTLLLGIVGVIEVALGASLLSRWRVAGARGVLLLFVVFSATLCWLVVNGHDVSKCGCFGGLDAPVVAHFVFVASVAWLAFHVASGGGSSTDAARASATATPQFP